MMGDPGLLTWGLLVQTKQPYTELDLEMDAAGLSWVRLLEHAGSQVTDLTRNNLGGLRSAWERVLTVSS